MWKGKHVSVVLMTYAERDSIRGVIDGFFATGVVDEVVVVDNNAEAGTAEEVAQTRARLVHEPRQGYGHATRRGLLEASGDMIVLAEPDGTFLPARHHQAPGLQRRVRRRLRHPHDPDLIWEDANMAGFLRWGNWAVAKLIELLFNTSHLSDVGCTYKLLRRETAEHVARSMRVGGNHAGVEIMLLTVVSGARFVEVPVNYLPRVGISSVTGRRLAAIGVGLRMIELVLRFHRATPRRTRKRAPRFGPAHPMAPEPEPEHEHVTL